MTLATTLGRLQTKLLTIAIMFPLAAAFAYIEDCTVYYTMIALMIGIGLGLEIVWGLLITHQPGWLTFVFAALEFSLIFGVIKFFQLDIIISSSIAEFHEGLRFYVVAWSITQLFLIYILPVWNTKWADEGRELW